MSQHVTKQPAYPSCTKHTFLEFMSWSPNLKDKVPQLHRPSPRTLHRNTVSFYLVSNFESKLPLHDCFTIRRFEQVCCSVISALHAAGMTTGRCSCSAMITICLHSAHTTSHGVEILRCLPQLCTALVDIYFDQLKPVMHLNNLMIAAMTAGSPTIVKLSNRWKVSVINALQWPPYPVPRLC